MTTGSPPSMIATTELVVPRSIPIILLAINLPPCANFHPEPVPKGPAGDGVRLGSRLRAPQRTVPRLLSGRGFFSTSVGAHLDLPGLHLVLQVKLHRQHAVLHLRLDFVAVDPLVERVGGAEVRVRPLVDDVAYILGVGVALSLNRQGVPVNIDVYSVLAHSGHLEPEYDRVLVLADIPYRPDRPAGRVLRCILLLYCCGCHILLLPTSR